MKKNIVIILVILAVVVVGVYFYKHNKVKSPADTAQDAYNNPTDREVEVPDVEEPSDTPSGQTNTIGNTTTPDHLSPGQDPEVVGPNIAVVEVDFNGTKFIPATVNIKVNDYVFFKNTGKSNFRPMSNPIDVYPSFDAGKIIAPGAEFKFQFKNSGTWSYNDFYHKTSTGTITVTQ